MEQNVSTWIARRRINADNWPVENESKALTFVTPNSKQMHFDNEFSISYQASIERVLHESNRHPYAYDSVDAYFIFRLVVEIVVALSFRCFVSHFFCSFLLLSAEFGFVCFCALERILHTHTCGETTTTTTSNHYSNPCIYKYMHSVNDLSFSLTFRIRNAIKKEIKYILLSAPHESHAINNWHSIFRWIIIIYTLVYTIHKLYVHSNHMASFATTYYGQWATFRNNHNQLRERALVFVCVSFFRHISNDEFPMENQMGTRCTWSPFYRMFRNVGTHACPCPPCPWLDICNDIRYS